MSNSVLVTGGTGFLGQQLVKCLIKEGNQIKLVSRTKDCVQEKSNFSNTEIIYSSSVFDENENWWRKNCEGIDVIVHLAWYTVPGLYNQSFENISCLNGSIPLFKGAQAAGIKHFVGIGTCFEYAITDDLITVDTPLMPSNLYSSCKCSLFHILSALSNTTEIAFSWCRPFYLFGEGEDKRRFYPYIHDRIQNEEVVELTKGNQIRDYLNVSDASRMIVKVIENKIEGPLNICSGNPITIRQFAENIADQYGRRDLLKFGERKENLFDPPIVLGQPSILL